MAYATGDTILDTHYNDFATSVNALWGTGTGDRGYGESTTVSTVSDGTTITAAQWTTLLARITSMASHQGSSITSISNPSAGDTIEAYTALSTKIGTIAYKIYFSTILRPVLSILLTEAKAPPIVLPS